MSFDANEYNVTVRRLVVDGRTMFEARVAELPDVRGFAESVEEAHAKAVEAIEALHEMALRDQEDFPTPSVPEDDFSGRVTLRMPKAVHRAIAQKAAEDGVSINGYIVTVLATSLNDYVRASCVQPVTWATTNWNPYFRCTTGSNLFGVDILDPFSQATPAEAHGQVFVNVMDLGVPERISAEKTHVKDGPVLMRRRV
jgi:predicted HicB family RNase H-like nuclease